MQIENIQDIHDITRKEMKVFLPLENHETTDSIHDFLSYHP